MFLDTVATGYQVVTIYNAPIVGDWLQFTFFKTNGNMVTLGVTNTTAGTTVWHPGAEFDEFNQFHPGLGIRGWC